MDFVVENLSLSPTELLAFNRCRMATQTMFLSDITSADGNTLLDDYRRPPVRTPLVRPSKWKWPTMRPKRTDWNTWASVLQRVFPRGSLPPPFSLGAWILPPHWDDPWRYDPIEETLWKKTTHGWNSYTSQNTQTRRPVFILASNTRHPTPQSLRFRATIGKTRHSTRFHLQGYSLLESTSSQPLTWESVYQELGNSAWTIDKSNIRDRASMLATAITNHTAVGVSDGSYKPSQNTQLAAAAWVILDTTTMDTCVGVLRTTGISTEINPYRSELQGFHSMMTGIWCVCKLHAIQSGSVTVAMDNEKACQLSAHPNQSPPAKTKHGDLIRAIRRIIADLPIQVKIEHVRGHQDEISGHQLSLLEQLNVAADGMAKHHLDQLIVDATQLPPTQDHIFKEGNRLLIHGVKATSDAAKAIRRATFMDKMRDHLMEKGKLDPEAFDLVDWEATEGALEDSAALFRLWAAKHASGQAAVGKMMHRWSFWDSPECPLCGYQEETTRHCVECPSNCSVIAREEGLIQLETRLSNLETHPEIMDCILHTFADPEHCFSRHASPWVALAAAEQDTISFLATTEGRLALSWKELQREHYQSQKSRRTAEHWASNTTQAILEWTHNVWLARCTTIKKREQEMDFRNHNNAISKAIDELLKTPKEHLLPEDYYLLEDKTRESLATWQSYDKEIWIQSMRWAIESAADAHTNPLVGMRQTMNQWLASGDYNPP